MKIDTDFEYLESYYQHGGTYELPVELVNDLTGTIEDLAKILNDIFNVVNNEKVSGIEAKMIVKDILDKENKR